MLGFLDALASFYLKFFGFPVNQVIQDNQDDQDNQHKEDNQDNQEH